MCNLGQGLVEMTELRTTANIVMRMMKKKHVSLEEALDYVDISDDERESVIRLIDKELGVIS